MTAEYLAQQRDEAEARAERLQRELNTANADLGIAKSAQRDFISENTRLRTERDHARDQLTEQATIIDRYQRERDDAQANERLAVKANHSLAHDRDRAEALAAEQQETITRLNDLMAVDAKTITDLRAKIDEQYRDINRLQAIARNENGTGRNELLARIAVLECELRDANHRADHWLKECQEWRASAETVTPKPASAPDTATAEAANSTTRKLRELSELAMAAFRDRRAISPDQIRDILLTTPGE